MPQPLKPYPQQLSIPPMTQLLKPPIDQNPPRTSQLPVRNVPNPNNTITQPIFNTELQPFLTYVIMTAPLKGVQPRLGNVLQ